MIQSRKSIIEEAFNKARGSSTKIILIQQKDERNSKKNIAQKNHIKPNIELKPNKIEDRKKIEPNEHLNTKSIDQKAKQFADFFNGEIVNLE